MNWEWVESARTTARGMLAIPWLVIGSLMFVWVAAPASGIVGPSVRRTLLTLTGLDRSEGAIGMPIDVLPLVVGALGVLIGYVWMWKLYRAPTRFDEAHWRFHDR